jgi:D-alanyl-D-alanine dipeptidase
MKNKIMPHGLFRGLFAICLTIISLSAISQVLPHSAYGLPIVNSVPLYYQMLNGHPEKKMQAVLGQVGLLPDLRYSTKNNFMKSVLYPEKPQVIYLRQPVVRALVRVLKDLSEMGLGLKVFDAYRPYAVTVELWEKVHDSRYAADPAKGSDHNRGIAVDLTLMDLKTHKSVEMPTGFDNFTDSAHQDFMKLGSRELENRRLLKQVMEKYGFIALNTEWWHFSWPHPENFALLDLSFSQLKEITEKR